MVIELGVNKIGRLNVVLFPVSVVDCSGNTKS